MSDPKSTSARPFPCLERLDLAMIAILRTKSKTEWVAMIFAANRTLRLRLEGHLRTSSSRLDHRAGAARNRSEDAAWNNG